MLADCGQFELWRKGEWVTKEDTGYATGGSGLRQEVAYFPIHAKHLYSHSLP
jgi:hypothetical protein